MSRRCDLNNKKGVMSGNNVSHSNRKTRRRFLPNMQRFSLLSDILKKFITLRLTPSSVRSVEHNDGLDGYLLTTSNSTLSVEAVAIKNKISKALAKTSVAS
jgi:large subunit ribosomal protein L28